MSISCLAIVYSMVCIDYCAQWNILNFDMVQCIGRNACGVSVHDTQNCVQWISMHHAKVVHTSCWRDGEEMHSGYRCSENAFYLVMLLCVINMDVQF
jgi:hypothetical protein